MADTAASRVYHPKVLEAKVLSAKVLENKGIDWLKVLERFFFAGVAPAGVPRPIYPGPRTARRSQKLQRCQQCCSCRVMCDSVRVWCSLWYYAIIQDVVALLC